MTQIVADAEMARQIAAAAGPVQIVNDHGSVIGVVTPVRFPHSPYSREEIEAIRERLEPLREEARKHPERCKTTAEVLAHLRTLDGESA
ncbi:unnamed protein product [Gemmataceae bacterium]|nr:unnamed protein product [Gemmataceae bacterium]VTU00664.1 unnamed protein product [Gemmataceae bacterium]